MSIKYMEVSIVLLVVFLSSWMCTGASGNEKCNFKRDIPKMQTLCKEHNEALLRASIQHNKKKICKTVILTLKCIAANMTRCYDEFHKMQEVYFHSPTYCTLTAKNLRDIQAIKNRQKKKKQTEKPEPEMSTSVTIETTSSPTQFVSSTTISQSQDSSRGSDEKTEITTSMSHTKEKGGGEGEGNEGEEQEINGTSYQGYTVSNGDKGVRNDGTKEQHKGTSDKSHNSSASPTVYPILVMAVALVSRTIVSSWCST